MKKRVPFLCFVPVMLVWVTVLAGCGIKSDPLPPLKAGDQVAAPAQLSVTREGEEVLLSWTHAVDPREARIPAEGFKVLAAYKGPESCQGCPFRFEPVGTVAIPDMQFSYHLNRKGRYYFKVRAVGADDRESQDSETKLVEYE